VRLIPTQNDSTKLVQDVKSHRVAQAEVRSSGSETIDATTLPLVILTDASPVVPIAVSLDSSVSDGFVCDVLNESTQTATFTPTSGDINDGTGSGSSQTLDAGTSCTLIKTSSGSPATANWKMLKGAGSGGSGGGAAWYEGSGAPSTLHNDGDFYLNGTNGDVYEQVSGSWGSPIANIKGPAGATGSTGTTGATGATGPAGANIGHGFYLNTLAPASDVAPHIRAGVAGTLNKVTCILRKTISSTLTMVLYLDGVAACTVNVPSSTAVDAIVVVTSFSATTVTADSIFKLQISASDSSVDPQGIATLQLFWS
jgi:hypothetical protein